jgi:hypothetical protein
MAMRTHLVKPPLAPPTQSCTQITSEWSSIYGDRPQMDGQGVAPDTNRNDRGRTDRLTPRLLFRPCRRAGRGVLGSLHWPVMVFRSPFKRGSTFSVEPSAQRWPLSLTDMAHQ